jgi:cytochrome c
MRLGIAAAVMGVALICAGGAWAQDAATGKTLFGGRCGACHQIAEAKSTAMAPSLKGVFGRKIAGLSDYAYSPAIKAKTGTWTAATLDAYLTSPVKFAPGGKMFMAVTNPAERADIIAYLKTVK